MKKINSQYRLFLIRTTIPLILLAVLWSNAEPDVFVLGLFLLAILDVMAGIIQLLWQPKLLDYRFAAARDVVYALAFYFYVLRNPHLSALILVPSVLAELFVLAGYHVFFRAVLVEFALLVLRMTTIYHTYHHLHPGWALLIGTASIVMGLLGLEITRLEALQRNITRQQEELKDTLTEMLATTLSPSGIDEQFLHQENISPMLEEICHDASHSKGHELGARLAEVIALQQAASQLVTAREQEVLELIAQDKSYGQIAKELQVSEGTVRAHAASLMRKAQVHCRNELIVWAQRHRLLQVNLQDTHARTPASIHS